MSHSVPFAKFAWPSVKERLDLALLRLVGRVWYERYKFRRQVGYLPNLHQPRTFNEKLSSRKLFGHLPIASLLSDKLAVRNYIESLGGSGYLTELCAVVDRPEELDFAKLPRAFVAKANHGSGMNVLVPDKALVKPEQVRKQLGSYLKRRFGTTTNEWYYLDIRPRVLVEAFLRGGPYGEPMDYKFLVFHGKAAFVQVLDYTTRYYTSDFYDMDWKPAGFHYPHRPTRGSRSRPARLEEMKELAETLSGGLDFIRVDLYRLSDERVRFGELTVTPGAGWAPIAPREAGLYLGSLW